MLFDSWSGLLRVLVVGSLAYAALVLLLRLSGKRTLAKLNAFDLVVTVALGSTLATVLLDTSVALAEGVTAFALLAGLQYAVAWLSLRAPRFAALVTAEPSLLLHRGRLLRGPMRRQRVTPDEVLAALRAAGLARPQDAAAVVLETDGTLSVLPAAAWDGQDPPPGLAGAAGPGQAAPEGAGSGSAQTGDTHVHRP
ncbi:DUF421 domain-containing protein [Pseudoroseomonas cervicalis]|uniref:DUF421 domain-containing protein n=1 Tax=Teichococcus cervicalis TaxID=204525 RepID=UPI0022F14DEF|nr:YetF domain-containing protein [Pseudoroseomonas cervicalis]WBV43328.1 DUF421 domain-containing protein [Pseudoroseomonas cervicalis]